MPKKGVRGGLIFNFVFFSISTGQKQRCIITRFQPNSDKEKQRFKSLETAPRNLRLLKPDIVDLQRELCLIQAGFCPQKNPFFGGFFLLLHDVSAAVVMEKENCKSLDYL